MEYELYHHGILGMKWGIRRFQNADGSLTPAGRKRLQKNAKNVEDARRKYEKAGFLKRGKARENYEKAREKYAKFASKLEYAKMSDAELLNASHEFVKNQNSQALRSQNVEGGANALAERIRLLSSAVNLASSSVQLFGQVRKEFNLGKVNKQQYELNERKQALEERKVKLDERKADLDYKKSSLDYWKNRENNAHDRWKLTEANKLAWERADIDRQKNKLDYWKNNANNAHDLWKTRAEQAHDRWKTGETQAHDKWKIREANKLSYAQNETARQKNDQDYRVNVSKETREWWDRYYGYNSGKKKKKE